MEIFSNYLEKLNVDQRKAMQRVINIVREHVPLAKEGLAYRMPAFKYKERPLIGFSSNKYGLNIYPFDPRVISALQHEIRDFESSKGVIRFSPQQPISQKVILLMVDLRLEYLDSYLGSHTSS